MPGIGLETLGTKKESLYCLDASLNWAQAYTAAASHPQQYLE